ncbi:unnamed protein product [Trichobilharzia regenti]|nr:unnamed protein product [Trichobilharzia regenti]
MLALKLMDTPTYRSLETIVCNSKNNNNNCSTANLYFLIISKRNIKSIRQLVSLPEDKRRALLRSLSDEQYRDILVVCSSMPSLDVSYRCEVS